MTIRRLVPLAGLLLASTTFAATDLESLQKSLGKYAVPEGTAKAKGLCTCPNVAGESVAGMLEQGTIVVPGPLTLVTVRCRTLGFSAQGALVDSGQCSDFTVIAK